MGKLSSLDPASSADNAGFVVRPVARASSQIALLGSAAVAIALNSSPVKAEELDTSSQESQKIIHKVQGEVNNAIPNYDATSNTFTVASKTPTQSIVQDVSVVDAPAIEKFLNINISSFNTIYSGDIHGAFDHAPEIKQLKDRLILLMEEKAKVTDEAEAKKIDKTIASISENIDFAEQRLAKDYLESVVKAISLKLPTFKDKLEYLGQLNKEDKDSASFVSFLQSVVIDGTQASATESSYKDVAYIGETALQGIAQKSSDVNASEFSDEEKLSFQNRFISLKDAHNISILSKQINESNVLSYLSDVNHDGKVSAEDMGVFTGKQLSTLLSETESKMREDGNEAKFYQNLSYVFGFGGISVDIQNRANLVEFLQSNPLAKIQFNDALIRINLSGADLTYVLENGPVGLIKWEQNKAEVYRNSLVGKLVLKIQERAQGLDKEIARLKKEGVITDQEYDRMLNTLKTTLNSTKFEEQILAQGVALLKTISATYLSTKNGGMQAQYSNSVMNTELNSITKKFIDSVDLSTGIYHAESGDSLMIGITYKGAKKLSETEALVFSAGINLGLGSPNNVLPVLSLGHVTNTNAQEVKDAGIVDFDLDEKTFKAGTSLSMLNTQGLMLGIGVKFGSDRKVAIEKKITEYSKLLDTVFECNTRESLEICIQHIQNTITSKGFEKTLFLADSLVNTERRLKALGFDTLKPQERQRLLSEEKAFHITKFVDSKVLTEEEKGWHISGWGVGVSLVRAVTGTFLIPGIEVSKMNMKYVGNVAKKAVSTIIENDGIGTESLVLNKDGQKLGKSLQKLLDIDGLSVSYEGGLLRLESSEANILQFLAKNGVVIHVGFSKKNTSNINFDGKTITIGDIGKILSFKTYNTDGKKVVFVIGDKGTKGLKDTVPFTQELADTLKGNTPQPLSENVEVLYSTITQQQLGEITQKKFGFGLF